MKAFANQGTALIRLDKRAEHEAIFDADWDIIDGIREWNIKKSRAKLQAYYSVAEFKPEVKTWFETNLGKPGSGQYSVKWIVVEQPLQMSHDVGCFIKFTDPKYAALFRLTFL